MHRDVEISIHAAGAPAINGPCRPPLGFFTQFDELASDFVGPLSTTKGFDINVTDGIAADMPQDSPTASPMDLPLRSCIYALYSSTICGDKYKNNLFYAFYTSKYEHPISTILVMTDWLMDYVKLEPACCRATVQDTARLIYSS